jgi:hypothetical protein
VVVIRAGFPGHVHHDSEQVSSPGGTPLSAVGPKTGDASPSGRAGILKACPASPTCR